MDIQIKKQLVLIFEEAILDKDPSMKNILNANKIYRFLLQYKDNKWNDNELKDIISSHYKDHYYEKKEKIIKKVIDLKEDTELLDIQGNYSRTDKILKKSKISKKDSFLLSKKILNLQQKKDYDDNEHFSETEFKNVRRFLIKLHHDFNELFFLNIAKGHDIRASGELLQLYNILTECKVYSDNYLRSLYKIFEIIHKMDDIIVLERLLIDREAVPALVLIKKKINYFTKLSSPEIEVFLTIFGNPKDINDIMVLKGNIDQFTPEELIKIDTTFFYTNKYYVYLNQLIQDYELKSPFPRTVFERKEKLNKLAILQAVILNKTQQEELKNNITSPHNIDTFCNNNYYNTYIKNQESSVNIDENLKINIELECLLKNSLKNNNFDKFRTKFRNIIDEKIGEINYEFNTLNSRNANNKFIKTQSNPLLILNINNEIKTPWLDFFNYYKQKEEIITSWTEKYSDFNVNFSETIWNDTRELFMRGIGTYVKEFTKFISHIRKNKINLGNLLPLEYFNHNMKINKIYLITRYLNEIYGIQEYIKSFGTEYITYTTDGQTIIEIIDPIEIMLKELSTPISVINNDLKKFIFEKLLYFLTTSSYQENGTYLDFILNEDDFDNSTIILQKYKKYIRAHQGGQPSDIFNDIYKKWMKKYEKELEIETLNPKLTRGFPVNLKLIVDKYALNKVVEDKKNKIYIKPEIINKINNLSKQNNDLISKYIESKETEIYDLITKNNDKINRYNMEWGFNYTDDDKKKLLKNIAQNYQEKEWNYKNYDFNDRLSDIVEQDIHYSYSFLSPGEIKKKLLELNQKKYIEDVEPDHQQIYDFFIKKQKEKLLKDYLLTNDEIKTLSIGGDTFAKASPDTINKLEKIGIYNQHGINKIISMNKKITGHPKSRASALPCPLARGTPPSLIRLPITTKLSDIKSNAVIDPLFKLDLNDGTENDENESYKDNISNYAENVLNLYNKSDKVASNFNKINKLYIESNRNISQLLKNNAKKIKINARIELEENFILNLKTLIRSHIKKLEETRVSLTLPLNEFSSIEEMYINIWKNVKNRRQRSILNKKLFKYLNQDSRSSKFLDNILFIDIQNKIIIYLISIHFLINHNLGNDICNIINSRHNQEEKSETQQLIINKTAIVLEGIWKGKHVSVRNFWKTLPLTETERNNINERLKYLEKTKNSLQKKINSLNDEILLKKFNKLKEKRNKINKKYLSLSKKKVEEDDKNIEKVMIEIYNIEKKLNKKQQLKEKYTSIILKIKDEINTLKQSEKNTDENYVWVEKLNTAFPGLPRTHVSQKWYPDTKIIKIPETHIKILENKSIPEPEVITPGTDLYSIINCISNLLTNKKVKLPWKDHESYIGYNVTIYEISLHIYNKSGQNIEKIYDLFKDDIKNVRDNYNFIENKTSKSNEERRNELENIENKTKLVMENRLFERALFNFESFSKKHMIRKSKSRHSRSSKSKKSRRQHRSVRGRGSDESSRNL